VGASPRTSKTCFASLSHTEKCLKSGIFPHRFELPYSSGVEIFAGEIVGFSRQIFFGQKKGWLFNWDRTGDAMKSEKRIWTVILVIFVAAMAAGCGGKGIPEKQFYSADGSVSILLAEDWRQKDAGMDNWIGASNRNGQDGVMVLQSVKGRELFGLEDMQEAVKTVCRVSELEKLDGAGAVPGLTGLEAYRCKLDMENIDGEGYLVYGETDYAYYAIVYAAKSIDEDKMGYIRGVCASLQENAPEELDRPMVEMTDTILWMNGTHAVLTSLNGMSYLIFGGAEANMASIEADKNMLSRQWGITDRASADEKWNRLVSRGHRGKFAEEMERLEADGLGGVPEEERESFLCENYGMDETEAERYKRFYEAYEEKGQDAIAAWDYSRAIMLMSSFYYVGYYEAEEALDKSLEIALITQKAFDSWDDFTDSYMMGYEYWAEEGSDFRRMVYEMLLEEPDSPYRLDWNIKLKKSW